MGISESIAIKATNLLLIFACLRILDFSLLSIPFLYASSVFFSVSIASNRSINHPWVFRKKPDGTFPITSLIIFSPYLYFVRILCTLRRLKSVEPLYTEVRDGLYVGGWPSSPEKLPPGDPAIIDCTCELPRLKGFTGGLHYKCIPTWDGFSPQASDIESVVKWACRRRELNRPIFVHCAYGHGRSVAVMCALLVALGITEEWKNAEKLIKQKRPYIRLNGLHRKALEEWSMYRLSVPKKYEAQTPQSRRAMGISESIALKATNLLIFFARLLSVPFLYASLVYFSVSIASNPSINHPWIFGKNPDGTYPITSLIIFSPYLYFVRILCTLRRLKIKEPPYTKVHDGLYVGGWPSSLEKLPPGDPAIIDCTCELPRLKVFTGGLHYKCIPTWDGLSPKPADIESAVKWARRRRELKKPIFVHCAYGHGRSVVVMCALLVALGITEDWKNAEKLIKQKRPYIRLNGLHRKALEEWSMYRLSVPKTCPNVGICHPYDTHKTHVRPLKQVFKKIIYFFCSEDVC